MLTFEEAIKDAAQRSKNPPSILLGNGFSRSYDDGIFSYSAILASAKFQKHGAFIRRAFEVLETSDFERIIRLFVEMRAVLSIIPRFPRRVLTFLESVERTLKEALAETLAKNHPEGPFEIPDEEYVNVNAFLAPFGTVYSLNYDLLLYWAKLHSNGSVHAVDDGFREADTPDMDYVSWEPENRYAQSIFYLHGALHLSDSGSEIRKFTWCRTGIRLKEQILTELAANNYPLVITEGHADAKKAKIFHNIYLSNAYKSLIAKTGVLFIFGASLGTHDEHILTAIQKGKISDVYLGIFGDPESESNRKTIEHALSVLSSGPKPKSVHVFDSQSVMVWR